MARAARIVVRGVGRAAVPLVVLVGARSGAFAADTSARPPLPGAGGVDCGAAATQQAANACEHERFLAAQAPMAAAYRALSQASGPGPREALRREQKAWLAWRTAACDWEASGVAGGSAAPSVRARCASRLTEGRTAELARRLDDCPEGDLACPARRR